MILEKVREAAKRRLLFLAHAVRQMCRPDRMITPQEVERVVMTGDLVEDYPYDGRGNSCLLLGFGDSGRAIHVGMFPKGGLSGCNYRLPSRPRSMVA
jgi:hypothetical protein